MKKFKKIIVSFVALLFIATSVFFLSAGSVEAAVRVGGYIKKSGTYVAPSYRSAPNKTKIDNYSTKGNYNPYTGKIGTKKLK